MADSGFELGRSQEDLAIRAISADKFLAVVAGRFELSSFDFLITSLA
jgi:hypothetical protein